VSQLVVTEGTVNASTDGFSIEIRGRQGHGARPHEAVDAVVVGSLLVTALQTIVSREVDPAHPSVVSVGAFHAGTAANVIAGRARLEGTIRAQEHEVRAQLRQAVIRVSKAIGELHGADVQVEMLEGVPPVINTPEMAALAREAAIAVVGEDAVTTLRSANMGGEDFAYCALQPVRLPRGRDGGRRGVDGAGGPARRRPGGRGGSRRRRGILGHGGENAGHRSRECPSPRRWRRDPCRSGARRQPER
jgi:amidohydrolase